MPSNRTPANHGRYAGRDVGIDVARGIAMLLVIYGHALEIYVHQTHPVAQALFGSWRFVYSFHMPLFFLLSGMVFRRKSVHAHLVSAFRLIFIAWMVHVSICLLGIIFEGRPPLWSTFVKPFIWLNGFQGVVVWFLPALALVDLAFRALLVMRGIGRWLMLALIFSMFVAMQILDKTVWQLSCLFPALVFYGSGYLVAQARKIDRGFRAVGWLSISALLVAWILAPLNQGCVTSLVAACPDSFHGFAVVMAGGRYGNPLMFVMTALAGSMGIVCLSDWLAGKGGYLCEGLRRVGGRTLDLLIINAFFFGLALPVLRNQVGVSADDLLLATAVVLASMAAQLALLPLVRPATRLLTQTAALLATKLGQGLFRVRMP